MGLRSLIAKAMRKPDAVLDAWKPADGKQTVLLRWLISFWCNYACPYCPQNHDRDALYGKFKAHAFDNRPVEEWCSAFERHFSDRNLVLTITGGEPMLDRRSMPILLERLIDMPTVQSVRIDTNASWNAKFYEHLSKDKLAFMCTFHPSQTTPEAFGERVRYLVGNGFNVAMINYVMARENVAQYKQCQKEFAALGIPLNPNPLWDSKGEYSSDDLELMEEFLPTKLDYEFRTQKRSPKGTLCRFPGIAYEMNPGGTVWVGCHFAKRSSFFSERLPDRFKTTAPCPHKTCVCLDKYSFVVGSDRNVTHNPLEIYGNLLFNKQNAASTEVSAETEKEQALS